MPTTKSDIDIKHLLAFDEIYKHRSISEAAAALGVSQPSISLILSKLRVHFEDPLFVRTPIGMQPTATAKALSTPIHNALAAFHRATTATDDFNPKTSKMTFRISLTDIGQVVLLPLIAGLLRELAPKCSLDVTSATEDSYKHLEAAELDLAFGSVRKLPQSFFQKNLFKEHFVCIASKMHPRVNEGLTVEQYLAERHVVVNSAGTGRWMIESAVDREMNPRNVVFELPTLLGLGQIVETTDLLGTVPIRLAEVLASRNTIKIIPLPVKIPSYDVKQYWHERQHNDPANKWLRGVIASIVALTLAKRAKANPQN